MHFQLPSEVVKNGQPHSFSTSFTHVFNTVNLSDYKITDYKCIITSGVTILIFQLKQFSVLLQDTDVT